ncbi:phytoene desaturase family protein [uncultured Friedmanniella sp.]|uniref:phytoene desaturase family protein n=1 Tax=uncultured Friedmanniella sp. TaxID=335381 RepID=UPI0035CA8465
MPRPSDPVVVVGGGLAGMAAAARLAKAGHPVQLFERQHTLGGHWQAFDLPGVGLVDAAPGVFAFPAPWRDLFRKSGRPLEAELARSGHALVPAEPVRHTFADGSTLDLPTERGQQYAVLSQAYGPGVAARWRDLLDGLDEVWQTLRPLGLERELEHHRPLPRPVRARLRARDNLATIAASLAEPHLTALVRSIAYRHGASPERTPAWVAVDLVVSRTFGRWQVQGPADRPGDTGRSSVLAEALASRLALRRVALHPDEPVDAVLVEAGRAVGVRTLRGETRAAAVVVTTDPRRLGALLPGNAALRLRRDLRRLTPAEAPTVTHELRPGPGAGVRETVTLTDRGVPVISYLRPVAAGTLVSRHDFTRTQPDPGAGVAWRGFRQWRRRPPVVPDLPGLYTASASSPAGSAPSSVILSGALASYACHDRLSAAEDR